MKNKYIKLALGQTIASLGIAMVINSNLGVFPVTACNMGFSNLLGVSFGIANMIVELLMIAYSLYRKESVGLATVVNALVGGFLIDWFKVMLPVGWFTVVGLLLLPVGWATIGSCGLGEPASNILMRALMKQFNKSVATIRTAEEVMFAVVGLMGGAPVTIFTVVLSVGFGSVLSVIYKAMKYEPTKIVHKTLTLKRK